MYGNLSQDFPGEKKLSEEYGVLLPRDIEMAAEKRVAVVLRERTFDRPDDVIL
jgi:hypothetical protein